jgi:ribonuclease VapC
MIVDSSAVIAILRGEPERDAMLTAIMGSDERAMSAASWLETAIVVDGRDDPVFSRRLDDLILALGLEIEDVTRDQAAAARQAYREFGRGRHRAGLNVGDCFAYALASTRDAPLLCRGNDFGHTDLQLVELAGQNS